MLPLPLPAVTTSAAVVSVGLVLGIVMERHVIEGQPGAFPSISMASIATLGSAMAEARCFPLYFFGYASGLVADGVAWGQPARRSQSSTSLNGC